MRWPGPGTRATARGARRGQVGRVKGTVRTDRQPSTSAPTGGRRRRVAAGGRGVWARVESGRVDGGPAQSLGRQRRGGAAPAPGGAAAPPIARGAREAGGWDRRRPRPHRRGRRGGEASRSPLRAEVGALNELLRHRPTLDVCEEEAAVRLHVRGVVPQSVHEIGHMVRVDHRNDPALGYGGP